MHVITRGKKRQEVKRENAKKYLFYQRDDSSEFLPWRWFNLMDWETRIILIN